MLALRTLTLPIAMAAFLALYTTATKAPAFIEPVNLILWIILPFLIAAKLVRTIKRNATVN